MLEYRGKYGSCKVMVDEIEPSALSQIYDFLNCPASEGATVRIMPDVHAGAGVTIGMTSTITSKVIPNMIGVDIGCGVSTFKFNIDHAYGYFMNESDRFQRLDAHIRDRVPSGFDVHDKFRKEKVPKPILEEIEEVVRDTRQSGERVFKSLGTLGGGNHFIELGMVDGDPDSMYLTIHSGSRNFGLQIATYHQKIAKDKLGSLHGMEWLEGADLEKYSAHMKVAQRYAHFNRRLMASVILDFFGLFIADTEQIESVHNYIDYEDGVIRKGAISAREGAKVVIPWNMRDGLILGVGKGNPDWNCSAPHGAGRVMGRGEAKRRLSTEVFQQVMRDSGVWSSCVSGDTLDESPMVYKDPKAIQDALADSVEVLCTVKPIYNFKAK